MAEEEVQVEIEEVRLGIKEKAITQEAMLQDQGDTDGDGGTVYAALLIACREAGYDASHDKRKELTLILHAVLQGDSGFPDDIMAILTAKTSLNATMVEKMLRPQVHRVLQAMEDAVRAEEARQAELQRLEEDKRAQREAEHERIQQKLMVCGPCPMGFSWHRQGGGWRCAGGSHYVSDLNLGSM